MSWPTAGKRAKTPARRMRTPMTSGFGQAAADPVENKCIQSVAFLCGCQAGVPHRSGRPFREVPGLSWTKAREHSGCYGKIRGQVHPDQVRRQIQEEGGIELAPMNRSRPVEEFAEVHAEDVHHLD